MSGTKKSGKAEQGAQEGRRSAWRRRPAGRQGSAARRAPGRRSSASTTRPRRPAEIPRLQRRYREEVRAKLRAEFDYKNEMQIPKLEKIVINMGVGEATGDQKKLDAAVAELARSPVSGR